MSPRRQGQSQICIEAMARRCPRARRAAQNRGFCRAAGPGKRRSQKNLRQRFASPRRDRARIMQRSALNWRGRREHRMLAAPASLACKESALAHASNNRAAETVRRSLRNGLRLMARSPRSAGLDSLRHPWIRPTNLTPASGCQDHTSSPSAPAAFVSRSQGVHRIPHHVS